MDLFIAICQGLGLALAIGAGGMLVPLFVAAMATAPAGIDLAGTDYEFVTEGWFLLALLVANMIAVYLRTSDIARYPLLAFLGLNGAIFFAASLAEEGETAWPGLVLGAVAAAGAAIVAGSILEGALRRAAQQQAAGTAGTLVLVFGSAGIVLAALALFVPPVSLVFAVGLAFLAVSRRRRAAEKFEGLRILR